MRLSGNKQYCGLNAYYEVSIVLNKIVCLGKCFFTFYDNFQFSGNFWLGPRAVLELQPYLKRVYEDYVVDCQICMSVVLRVSSVTKAHDFYSSVIIPILLLIIWNIPHTRRDIYPLLNLTECFSYRIEWWSTSVSIFATNRKINAVNI